MLEAYVSWLNNLNDSDRSNVIAATNGKTRLERIREMRDRQWSESLAANLQKQLPPSETDLRRKLLKDWKAEENLRREEWAALRKNPLETLDSGKIPWPFDNEKLREEIVAFAKIAFRIEDKKDVKGSRLTANDLDRYNKALSFAKEQGGAAWFTYGKTLYELVKKPEHEEIIYCCHLPIRNSVTPTSRNCRRHTRSMPRGG